MRIHVATRERILCKLIGANYEHIGGLLLSCRLELRLQALA